MTPAPSHAPKQPAILLAPVPSIQPRFATPPSPPLLSPPPSTQARHPATVATRHGKRTLKKTVVDRFNDSRQEESRRLNSKRKMEHDEKMASMRLKRHKYDLRYGSAPQTPGLPRSSTAVLATPAATKEDKEIEILRLKIRLAELTRDNSAHASSFHASSSSQMPHASSSRAHASSSRAHASSSRMPHDSLRLEEVSTPSSGTSSLSYLSGSHNAGFVDNNFMTSSEDYPVGETSDMTDWPETYNFADS